VKRLNRVFPMEASLLGFLATGRRLPNLEATGLEQPRLAQPPFMLIFAVSHQRRSSAPSRYLKLADFLGVSEERMPRYSR
jgi:hypothetical protein